MRPTNTDTWDGYPAQRDRVLDFIGGERMRNLVILTGDAHSSWGFDVPRRPWNGYERSSGAGSLAVELVTPAISSPPPPMFTSSNGPDATAAIRVAMPHLKFMDGAHRGFVLVELTPQRMKADWFFSPDVRIRSDAEIAGGSLVCERASAHLEPA
jgi:alkaline phosphatase D